MEGIFSEFARHHLHYAWCTCRFVPNVVGCPNSGWFDTFGHYRNFNSSSTALQGTFYAGRQTVVFQL
jgi:hypothetical protein